MRRLTNLRARPYTVNNTVGAATLRDAALRRKRRVGAWLSLVEHLVRDQGVGGSNPLAPTILFNKL